MQVLLEKYIPNLDHSVPQCKQLQEVERSPQKKYIDDEGFVWEKAREGEFYRIQLSETNHLHVGKCDNGFAFLESSNQKQQMMCFVKTNSPF